MKRLIILIACAVMAFAFTQVHAYTISYTNLDNEFFTMSDTDVDYAPYFADSLTGLGADPATVSAHMTAITLPVTLAETVNGWRMDLAGIVGFSCPSCYIRLEEHSSYQTTTTGEMWLNVSDMQLDNSQNPSDVFFSGTSYITQMDFFYSAELTGSPSDVGAVSAVPVPAAAWLFGSGLIGMVGIARRKSNTVEF